MRQRAAFLPQEPTLPIPIILSARGTLQNAAITGDVAGLPNGWITLAGPMPHANGGNASLGVLIEVLDSSSLVLESYGPYYAKSSGATRARPNFQVFQGWQVRIVAFGSTSFPSGAQTAQAIVIVSLTQPTGGAFVPPWEGPHNSYGDHRTVTTADPAAGVNPAQQTVGGRSAVRIRGVRATLVSAVAAATRVVHIDVDDGTSGYGGSQAGSGQDASRTVVYVGAQGTGVGNQDMTGIPTDKQVGVPEFVIRAAHRFQIVANQIQPADDWGAAVFGLEEWAVLA